MLHVNIIIIIVLNIKYNVIVLKKSIIYQITVLYQWNYSVKKVVKKRQLIKKLTKNMSQRLEILYLFDNSGSTSVYANITDIE